jgi:hypothetical protein
MAINIKSERTVEAVRRLAAHLDVSYTRAIEVAAEQALSTPRPSAEAEALARVNRIAAEYRAHRDQATAVDASASELYDAEGLYR